MGKQWKQRQTISSWAPKSPQTVTATIKRKDTHCKTSFDKTAAAAKLLLSHFSRVQLSVTPETAAHQAPPSLGFSRQEHWSGLPFPSPMHEYEKCKWSSSVKPNPQRPHGLQPSRLPRPWDFPGKNTGVGCHCLLLDGILKSRDITLPTKVHLVKSMVFQ